MHDKFHLNSPTSSLLLPMMDSIDTISRDSPAGNFMIREYREGEDGGVGMGVGEGTGVGDRVGKGDGVRSMGGEDGAGGEGNEKEGEGGDSNGSLSSKVNMTECVSFFFFFCFIYIVCKLLSKSVLCI